ncbi:MAG TPA: ATP-binding protein [Atopostipes sp.]|nr:ATP-binding protein [Atopostipes sp.]
MNQIKRRLYGLYFLIVATFVFLMYFVLSTVVENQIIDQQQERLNDEIVSLTEYIEGVRQEDSTESFNSTEIIQTIERVAPVMNERITLFNTEGQPLYDSVLDLDEIQNLFNFSEIQQILDGETVGVVNRENTEPGYSLYFVAQAIYNDANQPIGILRISSEIADLASTIQLSLIIQLIGTVILAIVLILLARTWINRLTRSIGEMQEVMGDLSQGEYDARYSGRFFEEIDTLGASVNELAENLEQQRLEIETSDERIYGLINHLIIGVMLLDEERRIRIVNPIMNELLGVNLYGKISHLYTDYVKSAELIELIEEAYLKNDLMNSEIYLYFPEEKTLDANVVPVPGKEPGEQNFIVLLYDITEIRRLENIRTDFAANVSHELRTPITALKGFSETLLDGAMNDEEVLKEFLSIMLKESTRLDTMVQDILQLSKLEQRNAPLAKVRIRIRDVAEEVFQILQQKIDLKKMTCRIEEKTPVCIYTNRDSLKQVLMNLIANAITYTPEKGTVIVTIDQKDGQAVIEVADNGIGIPKEDQARIFERFYRVDKARSRNSGGTGLGLSIVKWVVDSLEGDLELYSEVDVGTTFKVTLPIETDENESN